MMAYYGIWRYSKKFIITQRKSVVFFSGQDAISGALIVTTLIWLTLLKNITRRCVKRIYLTFLKNKFFF